MNNRRPVNLDIGSMALPLTAYASITHRITGVFLFIGSAFMVWALYVSLQDQAGFSLAKSVIAHPLGAFITWGLLSSLAYHFVAGLKHLAADLGFAETKESSRLVTQVMLVIFVVLAVLAGVWVW